MLRKKLAPENSEIRARFNIRESFRKWYKKAPFTPLLPRWLLAYTFSNPG